MSKAGSANPAKSIAVVGGGIIGLSVAWRLAQLGWQITVYDQAAAGGEASWAGAGMLAPGGEVDSDSEMASLAIESRRMYTGYVRELETASGEIIDYQECGALELAYSLEEWEALERKSSRQCKLGIHSKPVSSSGITAFWPRVRTVGLAGARFYPGDGIVNPREIVSALKIACRQLGVSIFERCPVRSAAIAEDEVRLDVPSAAAAAVVLAAGAWSGSVEITGTPRVPPSEPVKGHLIGYQQPAQTCATIVRHGRTYLLQRAGGMLLAGASVEHAGFDRTVSPQVTSELAADAAFILPHLGETTATASWIGFRPASDALHIGQWHSKRLYLAYGHYRNGILLAPITAGRIAAAVTANLGTP